MQDIDEDRIRERAYALSEQAGHPLGQDQHFWQAARLDLLSEDQAAELAEDVPEVLLKRA